MALLTANNKLSRYSILFARPCLGADQGDTRVVSQQLHTNLLRKRVRLRCAGLRKARVVGCLDVPPPPPPMTEAVMAAVLVAAELVATAALEPVAAAPAEAVVAVAEAVVAVAGVAVAGVEVLDSLRGQVCSWQIASTVLRTRRGTGSC